MSKPLRHRCQFTITLDNPTAPFIKLNTTMRARSSRCAAEDLGRVEKLLRTLGYREKRK